MYHISVVEISQSTNVKNNYNLPFYSKYYSTHTQAILLKLKKIQQCNNTLLQVKHKSICIKNESIKSKSTSYAE